MALTRVRVRVRVRVTNTIRVTVRVTVSARVRSDFGTGPTSSGFLSNLFGKDGSAFASDYNAVYNMWLTI